MKLEKIIRKIEQFYPLCLQETWDNVGLQIGDRNKDIKRILTVLEITDEVIEEAVENNIDLIVCHHPIIFKGISSLDEKDTVNKKIIKLIKSDIAVYAAHTNVDIANNGMNDWIAEVLGVKNISILNTTSEINVYSIHIEVDMQHINVILDSLPKIGVGKQLSDKEEQYLLLPKVKNFKDLKTKKNKTKDITVIEARGTKEEISVLKKYLYKLKLEKNIYTKLSYYLIEDYKIKYGLGRVGVIKAESLEMLAERIKNEFNLDYLKIVGSRENIIKRVAIIGGSGSSFIKQAKEKKCDALITGDIGFHDAQLALDLGISLIDGGHYLEIIFNDGMKQFLDLIEDVEVVSSKINSNPFEVI